MSKIIITEEAKQRILNASFNGSTIATDILPLLKNKQEDVIVGKPNYFASKRIVTNCGDDSKRIRVEFSYCNKDLTNPQFPGYGDPEAPNRREYRTKVQPATFVDCFKLDKTYTDEEKQYFDSAVRCSKVRVKLESSMASIREAYDGNNYSSFRQDTSTLHNSCMRHEDASNIAGDFYANFAGAKILIARNAENEIVARALVWEHVQIEGFKEEITFIDRIYTAFDFLLPYMQKKAQEMGILFRKTKNTYSDRAEFTCLNPITLHKATDNSEVACEVDDFYGFTAYVRVPAIKYHKKGSPYLDTFSDLCMRSTEGGNQLVLANRQHQLYTKIAGLQSTALCPDRNRYICPVCGKVHENRCNSVPDICQECRQGMGTDTAFGFVMKGNFRTYKGKKYPSKLFTKSGKPSQHFAEFLAINRLFD